ncbi:MAG: energy transducer TonB [Woeseiaceae bacterium]
MKTSILRSGLISVSFAALSACTVANMEPASSEDQAFGKPKPEFPMTEYSEAHEGWVMVGMVVSRAGLVTDLGVLDSSGSDAFDTAAIDALQHWRFAPGGKTNQTALVNFEFDYTVVGLSRRFMSLNSEAHKLIDEGDLDGAERQLDEIRSDMDLSVFELAYSYLTEGRIAGERGDSVRQLNLFRKAVWNEGRWLARDNYLATLRAIVILEIDLQDYGSAVRDYDLLVKSSIGKRMASDLKEVISTIRSQMKDSNIEMDPYLVADNFVSVQLERPKHDPSMSVPPIDPRGTRAPPTQPPSPPPPGQN